MKFLSQRITQKVILFFILLYFTNIAFLKGYYDYAFENEDELDYALESGSISYEIYNDLKNELEFIDEENPETEKPQKKFNLNMKNVIEPENYFNKSDSLIGFSKLDINFNDNLHSGILFLNKNKLNSHYDSQQNIFIYDNLERTNSIEKFFVSSKIKNTNIFIGNFRAKFGMGLTFAKTNSMKNDIYSDINLPLSRSVIFRNQYYKNYIPNNFLKGIALEQEMLKNFKLSLIYSDSKNPLDDIKNTKTIEYVFFDKYMIDKTQIATILKAIEDANNENRNIKIDEYIN